MTRKHYVKTPRLQVVIVQDDQQQDVDARASLFSLWTVLHFADGEPPTTVWLDGPFNASEAVDRLQKVYSTVRDGIY